MDNLFTLRAMGYLLLAFITWGGCHNGKAANRATFIVRVNFYGTPDCVVNNNKPILVDFGKAIDINAIDGETYQVPVSYTLKCSANVRNAMKMGVIGLPANFDADVLKTSKDNLGIALSFRGTPMPLNRYFGFTWSASAVPELKAALVKRPDAKLTGGPFTAGATLQVIYP